MVRTIPVMSLVVFAIGCGGGQKATTPPPIERIGSVEVRAWPHVNTHELLQRTSDKPANVIVTVTDPSQPAIAWVTSDGSDLLAVYCVSPDELDGAQARVASQRKKPIAGFIELGIKPDFQTKLCQPAARLHPPAEPPPPPPTPPPAADGTVTTTPCQGDDAACNYVILSPGRKGPGGTPPPPDKMIQQRFDLQLQRLQVFIPRARPGTTSAPR
jgi:hypothetical protein